MRLFTDARVIIAAASSPKGAHWLRRGYGEVRGVSEVSVTPLVTTENVITANDDAQFAMAA